MSFKFYFDLNIDGENNSEVRKRILDRITYLGITIIEDRNKIRGQEIELTTPESNVKIMVVPTNEELAIARDTLNIASKLKV